MIATETMNDPSNESMICALSVNLVDRTAGIVLFDHYTGHIHSETVCQNIEQITPLRPSMENIVVVSFDPAESLAATKSMHWDGRHFDIGSLLAGLIRFHHYPMSPGEAEQRFPLPPTKCDPVPEVEEARRVRHYFMTWTGRNYKYTIPEINEWKKGLQDQKEFMAEHGFE